MKENNGWNENLALVWTHMVGPSRPTISELAVYTKYAHILMQAKKRRLKLLILGSTPEFRDWGFEENMEVTVMDCNLDYHNAIARELRHKSILYGGQGAEILLLDKWQNLQAKNEYDIIIGDLAIGNIPPNELDNFLHKVSIALSDDGLFLGKSFFVPRNYKPIHPRELIKHYYEGPVYHPYSALTFDLTIYSLDENYMLSFQKQYHELEILLSEGLISKETMSYFYNVGWNHNMKFGFYVPPVELYEELLTRYMSIYCIEYGIDVYSPNFPLYIVTKNNSTVFKK